ncbi:MAG: agmatine deiminase family protein, partial [Candidatus Eisenbacteria bacterium]|nr:agmatine deiminase family protein [Candidatus Eisenbacteria bacterium]
MQQSGKQQRQGPLFSLIILFLGIISLLASPAMAGDGRYQPTDEAHSLPIYMTDEELGRIDEIGIGHRSTDPPPQTPRNCAEWEPLEGVLIRYPLGLPYDLISDFADHFTVYCLVSSGSYSSAVSSFTANGVNMANVEFLIINTDSIWTRDYGPWFVFDGNGDRAVVDHIYNRPRPNDDAVNWQLGPIWGIEVYGHDLHHTGGNYMTDGHGISFSTDLVWNENTGLSHSQIDGIMEEYLGIHTYNVVPDVASTGIHHIDCWAKLLNEETIMVKEVPPTHGDYPECEANAAYLATLTNCYGRPYNVVRIYCPTYSGSSVCAYTNSLILEDRVYVPMFGSQYDDDAIATYEAAMPGYTVLGYDGSWYSDDAIHCRGKGIMDDGMLYVDHNPLQEQTYGAGGYNVVALIDDRSETGLVTGEQVVYWRLQGEGAWTTASLTAMAAPDSFETTIPEQPIYSVVEYYISAEDYSGRISTRPWVAPGGYYTFTIEPSSGIPDGAPVMAVTRLAPNPFHPETSLRF